MYRKEEWKDRNEESIVEEDMERTGKSLRSSVLRNRKRTKIQRTMAIEINVSVRFKGA